MFKPHILFSEDGTQGGGSTTTAADTTGAATTNGTADAAKLQTQINELNNKLKEAIASRDEAKGKLRELNDAELIKKGELQKLLDAKIEELDKLKPELEKAKTKLAEVEATEKQEIEELLKELPDDEHREIAKDFTLSKLRKYLKKVSAKPAAIGVDSGSGATATATLTDAQKKLAKEMFPYLPEQKAYEHYIYVQSKIKKKD